MYSLKSQANRIIWLWRFQRKKSSKGTRKAIGIDCRVQHNIDVAKDRINEYCSIKNKDRSERIEMLREIYSGIIPKPEAGDQDQDQDHVSVHNYTLLY